MLPDVDTFVFSRAHWQVSAHCVSLELASSLCQELPQTEDEFAKEWQTTVEADNCGSIVSRWLRIDFGYASLVYLY